MPYSVLKTYFAHDLPSLLKTNLQKVWQAIAPNHNDDISLLDDNQLPLSDEACSVAFNMFSSVFTKADYSDDPGVPKCGSIYGHPSISQLKVLPPLLILSRLSDEDDNYEGMTERSS